MTIERNIMTSRMYVTDLDGTLLNSDGELSEYSVDKLNELISKGKLISVASARSLSSIQKLLKKINVSLPVISFNGGYVSDFNSGEHFIVNDIKLSTAIEIYEFVSKEYGMFISTNDSGKDILIYDKLSSDGMKKYHMDREKFLNVPIDQISSIDEVVKRKIMAYTIIDTKEKIQMLKVNLLDRFGDQIIIDAWEDMYYKPWYWLTIHDKSSTKANGLISMKKLLDVEVDELIVFGDNNNDIEMFKYADKSYAVSNAVSTLKKLATEVIGHHDENSVVKKICLLEEV